MDLREKELVGRLMPELPELRTLVEEHQKYEAQLEEFDRRPYLPPEEELDRKKIQKAKLAAKDRIAKILNDHK